ncbi:ER lumen protein retaining receptor [Paragonimus westermani]|uniref:ER lumen protein-retaining receptor n=1 Tax=Paragonimus westermani TaxID=34504 RepID=A0A5J4NPI3_9TREM|nr:ER lumen protein retaining receptor [Paragonimus westermani]
MPTIFQPPTWRARRLWFVGPPPVGLPDEIMEDCLRHSQDAGVDILPGERLTDLDYPDDKIMWTFSIYLESVAILPQLFMISRTGQAETITAHYLFALGSYRALYIFNWIDRYVTEDVYDLIAIVAGCVQTLLYIDFFYLYVTKVLRGKALVLPV